MEWNGTVRSVLQSVLFPFAIRSLPVYQNEWSVPFCKTGIFLVFTVCLGRKTRYNYFCTIHVGMH